MKLQLGIVLTMVFLASAACTSEPTPNQTNATADTTDITATNRSLPEKYADIQEGMPLPTIDCDIEGEILDANQYWLKESETLILIKADSSTYDEDLQVLSHRILEVYQTGNCELQLQLTLPVNQSADFPYYLANINYNNNSKLVAIRGYSYLYLYDINAKKLSKPIVPEFENERFADDAQSGRIQRIELWENYLIGHTVDFGVFAFNINNSETPEPAMPIAEWLNDSDQYHSLFLLSSQSGGEQAFIPVYDSEDGRFSVNAMFTNPINVNTNRIEKSEDQQFIILRDSKNRNQPYLIDLKNRKMVDLPEDISKKNNKNIMDWASQSVS